ncbi:hypothetical protein [Psychrobacillus sp. NPDC096389]|uniref:hypothetical protein n=1 Tax=Psychrobacillus sp. NPDC096389 TaxID=3364490 RepID=UPI0037F3F8CE
MRNPNRIPKTLSLLKTIWEHQPDVLFNQLISSQQHVYLKEQNRKGDFFIWKMRIGLAFQRK